MGFRVWGLGFKVWGLGLGFRVWGLRFGVLGCRRARVSGLSLPGFRGLGPKALAQHES